MDFLSGSIIRKAQFSENRNGEGTLSGVNDPLYRQLEEGLFGGKYFIQAAPPDGDCLYWCLSMALFPHQDARVGAWNMRQNLSTFLARNRELFDGVLSPVEIDRYIVNIKARNGKDGQRLVMECGDAVVISIAYRYYGRNVRVFNRLTRRVTDMARIGGSGDILLLYNGVDHYDLVCEVGELLSEDSDIRRLKKTDKKRTYNGTDSNDAADDDDIEDKYDNEPKSKQPKKDARHSVLCHVTAENIHLVYSIRDALESLTVKKDEKCVMLIISQSDYVMKNFRGIFTGFVESLTAKQKAGVVFVIFRFCNLEEVCRTFGLKRLPAVVIKRGNKRLMFALEDEDDVGDAFKLLD